MREREEERVEAKRREKERAKRSSGERDLEKIGR